MNFIKRKEEWYTLFLPFYQKISIFYVTYLFIIFRVVYVILTFLSFVILIIEYGIYYPLEWEPIFYKLIKLIIYFFLFYEFINLILFRNDVDSNIKNYWNSRKIEIILAILVFFTLITEKIFLNFLSKIQIRIEKMVLIYLSISQVLILINNFFHFSRNISNISYKKVNPSFVFVISFLFIILVGFVLLSLPKMHTKEISTIDILFVVISAVCVTGLSPIDIGSDLSLYGQIVLLCLIQIGGLGLMTLTSFFSFYFSGRMSLANQIMMRELLSEYSLIKVKKILMQIILFTLIIETIGFFYLYLTIPDSMIPVHRNKFFYSVFHSISAFCNAGFSLWSDNLYTLSKVQPLSIYGIMIIIMFGGIGFPVIQDLIYKIFKKNHKFSLTTKIVLVSNIILWCIGFLVFVFFSQFYHFNLSFNELIMHGFVFTITPRTAGFNTLFYDTFPLPLIFFTFLLMWIGTSPVSTGGGIKTTTITIALFHILSLIRGKEKLHITNKEISKETIIRAYSNVLLSLMTIFLGIFLLSIVEKADFLKITFEVVSAYGTVGLSLGITSNLTSFSKIVLSFIMLTGRVGVLSLILAIVPRAKELRYEYPKEYVVVG